MSLFRVQDGFSIEGIVDILKHTASPEGIVTARPGSYCSDVTNGIIYAKMTGVDNTGWVALNGPESNFRGEVVNQDPSTTIVIRTLTDAVITNMSIYVFEISIIDDNDPASMIESTYKLVVKNNELKDLQHGTVKFGTTLQAAEIYADIVGNDVRLLCNMTSSATSVTIDYYFSLLKRI